MAIKKKYWFMKNLRNWKIIIFIFLVVSSIAVLLFLIFRNRREISDEIIDNSSELIQEPKLHVYIPSVDNKDLEVGEVFEVEIFLRGDDVNLVSVFETAVEYNADLIEYKSASAAGFFVEPIKLAWGENNNFFALSFNPKFSEYRNIGIMPVLPILKLKFIVTNDIQPIISLKPEKTKVYLFKTGLFSPPILQ